ncbi:MAG: hypothetical protein AMXMBFR53_26420 [Gemmatimonadota bacterium]
MVLSPLAKAPASEFLNVMGKSQRTWYGGVAMHRSRGGSTVASVLWQSSLLVLVVLAGCHSGEGPLDTVSGDVVVDLVTEVLPQGAQLPGNALSTSAGVVSLGAAFWTPAGGYAFRPEVRLESGRIDVVIVAEQKSPGVTVPVAHRVVATIRHYPAGQHRLRVLVEFPGTAEPTQVLLDATVSAS